jgi:hypothetical protein
MKFTTIQKEIIQSIVNKKTTDIHSYINIFFNFDKSLIKPSGMHNDPYKDGLVDPGIDKEIYIVKEQDDAIQKIRDYSVVIHRLEKNDLIYLNNIENDKDIRKSFYAEKPKGLFPDRVLFNILNKFYNQEIIVTPELKDFVDRNYLTFEENEIFEERKHRIKAQRLTIIIAIFSILGTIGTTLFQYFTYTNERVVLIKNENAFSDTLNIRIIDEMKNHIALDSLKIKGTNIDSVLSKNKLR